MQASDLGTTGGRDLGTDGPVVLLVHGAGMDRTVWSLQTRWLAHHGVPALAIDLPGHGKSPDDPLASIVDYGTWLAAVVETTFVDHARPVHLVGHSMGTYVAAEAAIRTEVASLTLVGTAAAMPVHPRLLEAAKANDPLAGALMSGWAFDQRTRTGAHPSPGANMVGSTQAMLTQCPEGVLYEDLAMCAAYTDAETTIAGYGGRVTFLLGTADRMTPRRNAQALIDAAQQPRVEEVDCGHMIQIEAPRRTRQVIADTVASRP